MRKACASVNHFKDLISSKHLIRHLVSTIWSLHLPTTRTSFNQDASRRKKGPKELFSYVQRLVQLTMHTVRVLHVPAAHTNTFHGDIKFPIIRKHFFVLIHRRIYDCVYIQPLMSRKIPKTHPARSVAYTNLIWLLFVAQVREASWKATCQWKFVVITTTLRTSPQISVSRARYY